MPVRAVESEDGPALRAFFAAIPEQDASFLKEDLTDPAVVEAWLGAGRMQRLVHVDEGGHITAAASIAVGVGRSDHVAELRLVVAGAQRRGGIGTELAQQSVLAAIRAGCRKVTVEVGATQDGTIHLFRGLGFVPEALHLDQVRADDGRLLDTMVMAHRVADDADASTGEGAQ